MIYLLVSLVALALGPALAAVARRARWTHLALDSFVLIALGGLVLLHIVPHAVEVAGLGAVAVGAVTFLLMGSAERGLHHHHDDPTSRISRVVVIGLSMAGLFLHAVVDGLALGGAAMEGPIDPMPGHEGHDHGSEALAAQAEVWAIAVLTHRLPETMSLWWILAPLLGVRFAVLAMVTLGLGTVVGYGAGDGLLAAAGPTTVALFEAMLAGTLLHVVLHADLPAEPRGAARWEGRAATLVGLLGGVATVIVVEGGHDHGTEHGAAHLFLAMVLDSAPALLLAYVGIGLMDAFVDRDRLVRVTRGSPLAQALRGVAIGIPLPVCSCGVVPIYRDLAERGAAPAAGLAFLIATPEIELAAVLLTLQLLGPEIAAARVAAAVVLAVAVALIVARRIGTRPVIVAASKASCCGTAAAGSVVVSTVVSSAARTVAATTDAHDASPPGPLARLLKGLRYGFRDGVDETATWIVVGLGLAAMLSPHLDPEWLAALPGGIDVPIAALIGMPMYVCASGSTPLAAVLIAAGLSPGAAVAFLLTGPATNITTFGVLRSLHGKGAALWFTGSVAIGATLLGLLVNLTLPADAGIAAVTAVHDHAAGPVAWSCLVALGGLYLASILRQGLRRFFGRLFETPSLGELGEPAPSVHAHHDH